MDTLLNVPASWNEQTGRRPTNVIPAGKFSTFINSRAKYEITWYLLSMIIQGIFFLPLPIMLILSFNAPVYILIFTLGLFFANAIAGMSNAGAKAIISLFAVSIAVHAVLLAIFTL